MRDSLYDHFNENMASKKLFILDCDNEELWNLYLNSFTGGRNPLFRERRELDCSACHSFFRKMANVVALDEESNEFTDGEARRPAVRVHVRGQRVGSLVWFWHRGRSVLD